MKCNFYQNKSVLESPLPKSVPKLSPQDSDSMNRCMPSPYLAFASWAAGATPSAPSHAALTSLLTMDATLCNFKIAVRSKAQCNGL